MQEQVSLSLPFIIALCANHSRASKKEKPLQNTYNITDKPRSTLTFARIKLLN